MLEDYFQQQFIHKFFNQLSSLTEDSLVGQIHSYLVKFVDFFVQISIVFNYALLKEFTQQLVDRIELLSSGFDEQIPEIIAVSLNNNLKKILIV